ncbi:unnamed protein product [Onchocerca flexuosa]|uniref:MMS22L_N domain-containing protein n=1 Tax=Onchocerca flexuosa TaxID=387005 RepID=A0A183HEU3_9BILA|nr:unnamed protein product [Onchocerca flexuosa]
MVDTVVLVLFKQWANLKPVIKKEFFDYFFGNALLKYRGSMEIRSELLKACAKLVKRSVFDGHACDIDLLASRLYALLTDQEPEFHEVVFEFFTKILAEFDSYWRLSEFGLSYDFQYKAKISFENNGLLKIYSKCLHIVSRFCIFIGNLEFPSNTELFIHHLC